MKLTHNFKIATGEWLLFWPLSHTDVEGLAKFLEKLQSKTREFSTFSSYDIKMAQELCDAIGRYDKHRFVVLNAKGDVVGLLEYSFGIPVDDINRYRKYNIELNEKTDCRWGPTLADEYQDKGVGSLLLPIVIRIAKQFGKSRIILFGGVLVNNSRAIHFYEKHSFKKVGEFVNRDGKKTLDMILDF